LYGIPGEAIVIIIGLTGSIGTGKSTTAGMFREASIPVHDSDRAVHTLYNGPTSKFVEDAFPGVLSAGKVDRAKLASKVFNDPEALRRLEGIIHPLVALDRDAFIERQTRLDQPIIVLDIPLLFELGLNANVDLLIVTTVAAEIQRERVLARPGMTMERYNSILGKQVPNSEKCRRAHAIVDTSFGMEQAQSQVEAILRSIRQIQNRRNA
jgi:dephospho-CoA kinase